MIYKIGLRFISSFLLLYLGFAGVACHSGKRKPAPSTNLSANGNPRFKYIEFTLGSRKDLEFFIPFVDDDPIECNAISVESENSRVGQVARGWQQDMDLYLANIRESCRNEQWTCKDYLLPTSIEGYFYPSPLKPLKVWDAQYPEYPIKVNTFAFALTGWPELSFKMPCAANLGLGKSTENEQEFGLVYSSFLFDYLLIDNQGTKKIRFIKHNELNRDKIAQAQGISAGILLAKDGKFLRKHPAFLDTHDNKEFKDVYRCFARNGRTFLYSDNEDVLHLGTVANNNKKENGASCEELVNYLLQYKNAREIFFFDGGGSGQLFVRIGEEILFTSDDVNADARPLPSFLGIKNINGNKPILSP